MNILFDNEILTRLVRIKLALLISEVKCAPSSDELNTLVDKEICSIRSNYQLSEINKLNNIVQARKAYKQIGNDPNRYRPSAESLIRRIVKGYNLYKINNVIDILNLISLQSGLSIGGYDLDKIDGEISMGIGLLDEPYTGIGRGPLNISKLPVLRDAAGAFGSPTSDSERTSITDTTRNILFIFFDFGNSHDLENWMKKCKGLLERFCSAYNMNQKIVISN